MENEKIRELTARLAANIKPAPLFYLVGFKEACSFHRVVIYCLRSRQLMIRTGQCFLLNGFIFLGSIFILRSVIIPILNWILPEKCPDATFDELCSSTGVLRMYDFLQIGLLQLFHVLWFYPLYILSFIISSFWYNDIAKLGLLEAEKPSSDISSPSEQTEPSTSKNASMTNTTINIEGVVIGIAEPVYSVILLTSFFLEVSLVGFLPYVGTVLNFLLLSWMYAYYCFEYKWNLSGLSLDKRLKFFETNWAFFAGFGSPCVLAIFFFSPLVSYGVMAVLFPLFVLTAAGSDANIVVDSLRKKWCSEELERLPIFFAAEKLSMWSMRNLPRIFSWIFSLFHKENRGQTLDKKAR